MVTLRNSQEPDSLICQFMELVDNFIAGKTSFKTIGYHELPTASGKVTQLSVFLAEKDYNPKDDNYACFRAPEH